MMVPLNRNIWPNFNIDRCIFTLLCYWLEQIILKVSLLPSENKHNEGLYLAKTLLAFVNLIWNWFEFILLMNVAAKTTVIQGTAVHETASAWQYNEFCPQIVFLFHTILWKNRRYLHK